MNKPKLRLGPWGRARARAAAGGENRYGAFSTIERWLVYEPRRRRMGIDDRIKLFDEMAQQMEYARRTGDAAFFKVMAELLERHGRVFCPVRCWLADKIKPGGERFTHEQLLGAAKTEEFSISDRQLRRLMNELGLPFKNSRKPNR